MIIEVDGYFKQALLIGQKCSKRQLKQMYLQANQLTFEPDDFTGAFCKLHRFEQIPYSNDIEVDFVLDTDTGRIYSPSY